MTSPKGERVIGLGGCIVYCRTDTLVLPMDTYVNYVNSDRIDVPAREIRDALADPTAE